MSSPANTNDRVDAAALLSNIPLNISIGYKRCCVVSVTSSVCTQLPCDVLSPINLDDLHESGPELHRLLIAIGSILSGINPNPVPIMLGVGVALLATLVVITNVFIPSGARVALRSREKTAFALATALGVSACAVIAATASFTIWSTRRIRSVGATFVVQKGDLDEACLIILIGSIATFMVTTVLSLT
ncbi:hypothetical protein EJ07DRAFT_152207 [Lizonia empirigonia]|nr:hypothetical protein EJ07DRAFT_160518 [Lizonia empirigonia]KAF1364173.1 hypothetical protein EJ07DRAFT_152207 [Lizonia empirigonia]